MDRIERTKPIRQTAVGRQRPIHFEAQQRTATPPHDTVRDRKSSGERRGQIRTRFQPRPRPGREVHDDFKAFAGCDDKAPKLRGRPKIAAIRGDRGEGTAIVEREIEIPGVRGVQNPQPDKAGRDPRHGVDDPVHYENRAAHAHHHRRAAIKIDEPTFGVEGTILEDQWQIVDAVRCGQPEAPRVGILHDDEARKS
ncbi:MAG: hypothetical protein NBV67_01160 [Tagaea sp.]|nr:hypothetical protein [Tagaea sp.]